MKPSKEDGYADCKKLMTGNWGKLMWKKLEKLAKQRVNCRTIQTDVNERNEKEISNESTGW